MSEGHRAEHVECSREGCKNAFHRPQDAMGNLSTADVAQLHGWTLIDRAKGLMRCTQHKE